uniref:Reverse transcriptase domain-containing protein n=1 Tax=Cannabis sativa TaxID=3483 RepID=A0A803PD18_CANSA
MDPLSNDIHTTLSLIDEERSIFCVHEYSPTPTERYQPTLLAKVLTHQIVYKQVFFDQMSGHWQGRFQVLITEYKEDDGLFHIKFECEGDKRRVEQLNNSLDQSSNHFDDLKHAETVLDELLKQEEIYWQQCSWVDWLACGDKYTKFFHAKANARKSKNQIKFLYNDAGVKVYFNAEISSIFHDYYADIFRAVHIDDIALTHTLECIPTLVSDDYNASLLAPFTMAEVKNALKTMSADKSPGIDGRLIIDNILVAFELVHAIKNKTTRRHDVASLKLDMSKAFDRIEWKFIEEVMKKMGFASGWISLIMSCLITNKFSFLVNGEVTGSLVPTTGLRQGCPLSPYLFLICAKGLSRLLQHEEDIGNLHGFKLTRRAPMISHLFFVDDSLLFCQADECSCLAIKRVLDTYHQASGQLINPEKFVMSFSPNTTLAAQVFFYCHLSLPVRECHERYLGLPSYSERDKKELFSNIKKRIWKLMQSWNEIVFSAGGREVLLKAVVQSILTYVAPRFIDDLGIYFAKPKEKVVWGFGLSFTLINLYSPSKHGVLLRT